MKILLKVSGSISVYKTCELLSKLKKDEHKVKVAASTSSLKFVGAATWEGLSGEPVFTDDFSPNRRMDHIHLNDWADLVVMAPATAQTLDALSQAVGSSVLTTLFLARKQDTPYLVFPAMNPRMWTSSAVQKSVEKLSQQKNIHVLPPSKGRMACGHVGAGRLNEVDQILDEIQKYDSKGLKALVTFGGTEETIDGVRSIGNFSSGKTGLEICRVLKKHYRVTALGSALAFSQVGAASGLERLKFKSSLDLEKILFSEISNKSYDLIVHAAAVSDFIPSVESGRKISSDEEMNIKWIKAPKILEKIREVSKNKNVKIVSFKLTHNQTSDEVSDKISKQLAGVSDYVVHNELTTITADAHPYSMWKKGGAEPVATGSTKLELARAVSETGRD